MRITHAPKKKKTTWKVYEAAGCVFQKVFYTWLCFSFNNKLFGFQTRTHALSSAARKQWRDISKDVIVCRINNFCVCLCFVFLFLCFGLRIDGWGQILFSHRKEFTWHVFGSFFLFTLKLLQLIWKFCKHRRKRSATISLKNNQQITN